MEPFATPTAFCVTVLSTATHGATRRNFDATSSAVCSNVIRSSTSFCTLKLIRKDEKGMDKGKLVSHYVVMRGGRGGLALDLAPIAIFHGP